MLCKARFSVVICVRWVGDLKRTSGSYARIDALRHRASFALDPKHLLSAVDADGGPGEVDEDPDSGWKARVTCVRDGTWIVCYQSA